ncbi:MAG: class II fructose-bisphosphate aldolase [Ruminococcaceae bacterium]|nr:class II fructose-bisphosphate aldolase [Oscillospiraceae bacterium]
MLVGLNEILKAADEGGYAIPAFNVYNMETVMGVIKAAEELRAPVIMQFYSRLATTGFADYLAPVILKAAEMASVPVCMHLDHGAGYEAAAISLKNGASGIMVDFSKLSLEENIEKPPPQ